MNKNRLEAFSDGVLAILITIMVLELHAPNGVSWEAVAPLLPTLGSYIMSFVFIGIYWGNHHHLLHTVTHVNGKIIWANLHLLFWLSLIPFVTAWMGSNNFASETVAIYSGVLVCCGISYNILATVIKRSRPHDADIRRLLATTDKKGMASAVMYLAAIPLAFVHPLISCALIVTVALIWIIPSKEIEQMFEERAASTK